MPHRNVSSLVLKLTSGRAIMMDCGEATQHQIQKSHLVTSADIDVILLTHLHGDHSFGIFGLLCTIGMLGRETPVRVVGPKGIEQYVLNTLRSQGGLPHYPIEFTELDGHECVLEFMDLKVRAISIPHHVPTYGYILEEKERPGKLDGAKSKQLGVVGSQLGDLKAGKDVTLPNGATVKSQDCVGEPIPGRRIALIQDTYDSSSMVDACQGADLVIHEATFDESHRTRAVEKGHSTAIMAAAFAQRANIKQLVLTHFSARYADDASLLESEARNVFGNTVAAEDFMKVDFNKDGLMFTSS